MADTALYALAGIAQGIEKASSNLVNLQLTKHKLKQENEAFALDKKVKEAQLKKMEFLYGPEQLEAERNKLKAEASAQKSLADLREIQIREARQKQQKDLELKTMAGVSTLQDLGLTNEQAREALGTLFTPDVASVKGKQVPVAPAEFTNAAMAIDQGQAGAGDVFMNKLGEVMRNRAGVNKAQAAKQYYGIKEDEASDIESFIKKQIESEGVDLGSVEKELDRAVAIKILDEAGGDKNKARELARQRGYKF